MLLRYEYLLASIFYYIFIKNIQGFKVCTFHCIPSLVSFQKVKNGLDYSGCRMFIIEIDWYLFYWAGKCLLMNACLSF